MNFFTTIFIARLNCSFPFQAGNVRVFCENKSASEFRLNFPPQFRKCFTIQPQLVDKTNKFPAWNGNEQLEHKMNFFTTIFTARLNCWFPFQVDVPVFCENKSASEISTTIWNFLYNWTNISSQNKHISSMKWKCTIFL